jgi:hypothetical protein
MTLVGLIWTSEIFIPTTIKTTLRASEFQLIFATFIFLLLLILHILIRYIDSAATERKSGGKDKTKATPRYREALKHMVEALDYSLCKI